MKQSYSLEIMTHYHRDLQEWRSEKDSSYQQHCLSNTHSTGEIRVMTGSLKIWKHSRRIRGCTRSKDKHSSHIYFVESYHLAHAFISWHLLVASLGAKFSWIDAKRVSSLAGANVNVKVGFYLGSRAFFSLDGLRLTTSYLGFSI